ATIFTATRAAPQLMSAAPQLQALARTVSASVGRARERVAAFFRQIQDFAREHSSGRNDYAERLPINRGIRVQPDWADIESLWFETEGKLNETLSMVEEKHAMLLQANPGDVLDYDAVVAEAASIYDGGEKLRS